jgi:hypothetical protein
VVVVGMSRVSEGLRPSERRIGQVSATQGGSMEGVVVFSVVNDGSGANRGSACPTSGLSASCCTVRSLHEANKTSDNAWEERVGDMGGGGDVRRAWDAEGAVESGWPGGAKRRRRREGRLPCWERDSVVGAVALRLVEVGDR